MVIVYEEPAAGNGAIYKWDSKNPEVGNGSSTITTCEPNKSVGMRMDFMGERTTTSLFKYEKADGGTKVTWSMDSELGMNPIFKYFGLFMNKMVGPDFERGLNKLKTVAESTPEIMIEATNVQEQPIISIRTTCNYKDIGQTLGQLYGELMGYVQKSGVKMTGSPLAIYYSYSLEKFDLEAALPVDKVAKPSGRIKSRKIQAGNVVVADYYGAYEGTEKAHQAIDEWVKTNNKTIIGPPWEAYITDPSTEPDTSMWLTKIYYPVM